MRVVLSSGENAAEFSTKLFKPLVFDGKWKVALTEITIPQSPVNFTQEDFLIYETFKADGEVTFSKKLKFKQENISSVGELQSRLTDMYKSSGMNKHHTGNFIFNEKSFKGNVKLKKGERIILSPRLAHLLSMSEIMENSSSREAEFVSEYCVDIRINFWNIYIYSNLSDTIILGEKLSQLLQTLPFENFTNERLLIKSYNPPVFLPLSKNFIPSIDIRICDELGRTLKFTKQSKTICKLLFIKDGA